MARAILLLLLLHPLLSCALAATNIQSSTGDEGDSKRALSSLEPRASSKPFALRTLPLGASITWGYRSQDGNGYREFLRNNMTAAGWEVNMIGSLRHGSMPDNDNEGHVGLRVDQVAKKAELSIPKKPNLILINAGTNDAVQHYKVSTAGERMDDLLDRLYEAIPGTTIILSTLLPSKRVPRTAAKISAQYRTIVEQRQNASQRIILADMSKGDDALTTNELIDKTHPTEFGYSKMALIWWNAIQEAESKGFLSAPTSVNGVDDAAAGQSSSNDKLTEAGKIAIGIVIPLGVITIGSFAFFLYRRRQRKSDGKEDASISS
ncbi:hypothetical protein PISL3812_03508 [Talaromyces islandicus]|uniref:SGNH hydrolase-type esterase domain-containing protein n=1 Tax=Talaromyces islandicus TaxID=28573 RepID=A0A0U1LTR4_TALIS|nr:hypothetical protein PISL3812_03508 [Talaromyces islandicus]